MGETLAILLALVVFLGGVGLSVYLLRRSWREAFVSCGIVLLFLAFYHKFFLAQVPAYHDRFWGEATFFFLIRQWVEKGYAIGWNPFMNGGEPLYLFSNLAIWPEFFFYAWVGKLTGAAPMLLFGHVIFLTYLQFCVGSYLLFSVLFKDSRTSLFCLLALCWSSFFDNSLGQHGGFCILVFLPVILYGVILFLRKRSVFGLSVAILFCGFALNRYLPVYPVFVGFVLMGCILILHYPRIRESFEHIRVIRSHGKQLLLVLIVAGAIAAPALYSLKELKDFGSPSRGSGQGVSVSAQDVGRQKRVSASLAGYSLLIESRKWEIHHAFYIGILPLFLCLVALFWARDKMAWSFFLAALAVALVAAGIPGILLWLYKLFPGFSFVRHTALFAPCVSFFLICASGYGLEYMVRQQDKKKRIPFGILWVTAAVTIVFLGIAKGRSAQAIVLFTGWALSAAVIFQDQRGVRGKMFLILLGILMIDLGFFNVNFLRYQMPCEGIDYGILDFEKLPRGTLKLDNLTCGVLDFKEPATGSYPLYRSGSLNISWPMPPDLAPLFLKQASLTNRWFGDSWILFRSKRLTQMMHLLKNNEEAQSLGVGVPLVYWTDDARVISSETPREDAIRTVLAAGVMRPSGENPPVFFMPEDIDFPVFEKAASAYKPAIFASDNPSPNRFELRLTTSVPGYLVHLENFHQGWKCFIDGIPAKVYRANYAFKAIRLPAGSHVVRCEFQTPFPLLYAVYLFLKVAVIGWVIICLARRRHEGDDGALQESRRSR